MALHTTLQGKCVDAGSVLGDIMEEVHEVTEYSEEELEEILADGAEWEDEHFVPDDLMGLEYSDDFPGWNAETKKWDSLDVVTEEDMEADAMHDDVDPPDLDETNPAELCRYNHDFSLTVSAIFL